MTYNSSDLEFIHDIMCSAELSVSKTEAIISDIISAFAQSFPDTINSTKTLVSSMADAFSEITDAQISAISNLVSSMASVFENFHNSSNSLEDDFVIADQKLTKEFEIPDTIAVPIGHKRVRIKTELFLSILISIFFGLVGCIQTGLNNQQSIKSEKNYQDSLLQIEEERNQIIHDFLDSIDLSSSSQSDSIDSVLKSIECLTDYLLSSEPLQTKSDLAPDPDQESCSNNPG